MAALYTGPIVASKSLQMASSEEKFFKETNEPHNLSEAKVLVQKFVDSHQETGSKIALVTVI